MLNSNALTKPEMRFMIELLEARPRGTLKPQTNSIIDEILRKLYDDIAADETHGGASREQLEDFLNEAVQQGIGTIVPESSYWSGYRDATMDIMTGRKPGWRAVTRNAT